MPQLFLIVSLGSGIEKIIEQNLEAPGFKDLIYSSEIYIPILAFMGLAILTIVARKLFYKDWFGAPTQSLTANLSLPWTCYNI